MREYSNYQKKVINRYYENRDAIVLERLQEMVGELYLAETEKKRERLWQRVAQAMTHLKVKPAIADHILAQRDPKVLASNLEDWLKQAG